MLKKIALSAVAASAMLALPAVADAQPRGRANGYWNNSAHARGHQDERYRDGRYDGGRYDAYARGGYGSGGDRSYDGYDSRYDGYDSRYDAYDSRYDDRYDGNYRRCSGSTGTVVGGAAGALVGRGVAGRGDRTIGTVIGAAAGAVLGRSVDRSSCRN